MSTIPEPLGAINPALSLFVPDDPPAGADDLPRAPSEPAESAVPFPAWIALQADHYAAMGTPAAAWLAARLRGLASDARFLGAGSPGQFDAREHAALAPPTLDTPGLTIPG